MAREFDFCQQKRGPKLQGLGVGVSFRMEDGEKGRCQGGEGAGKGLVVFASCRSAGGCRAAAAGAGTCGLSTLSAK